MSAGRGETFGKRRDSLRKVMKAERLDVLLLYSQRGNSPLSQWVAGAACTSAFHYYVLTSLESYFLEVSYRAADLRARTSEMVREAIDEDDLSELMRNSIVAARRIGLAGPAPWSHMQGLSGEVVDCTSQVEDLTTLKDVFEQQRISDAAGILRNSLEELASIIQPGVSEKQIAEALLSRLFPLGEGFPFAVSVVSGSRLAESTVGAPSSRVLGDSDWVLIDAGLTRDGFQSDCTRMFFTGQSSARENFQRLVTAHDRVIESLRPGIRLAEVLSLYRREISSESLPVETLDVPCLGHGIGFALHERPLIYREQESDFELAPGMIFTLEPEIVFPSYRLRIEDMILMTEKGARKLT